jgi:hypothetical protein
VEAGAQVDAGRFAALVHQGIDDASTRDPEAGPRS